ncbi:MAG TPA: hypothetical protein VFS43_42715 [Polyangiaceae bacterium]|nr:hypothetical protein [Polyangiaceae bacterium]
MTRADSPGARDEAWLRSRARGEAGAHPDPGQAAGYERLERALGELPRHDAPASFRADLSRALDREVRAPGRRWLYSAVPLAAAALALLVWGGVGAPPDEPPTLAHEIVSGGVVRGDFAARGDLLRVRARLSGEGELRVYRDGSEIVLRCRGAGETCREGRDGGQRSLRGELELSAPGRYDVVLLSGKSAPRPAGRLEDDLRAARAAGAKIFQEPPVTVH